MFDLKEFLKAGVHFGHKSSRWSPKMQPFIWGSKNKIHLIDISKTAFLLDRAGKYIKDLAADGKSFLWVGTKKPAQSIIKKIAEKLEMPFVANRWIGGTLTNFDQIKKAIKKFLQLKDIISKVSPHHTKKEISEIQKEIARLEKKIGGVVDLVFPPAAIILVDAKKEHSVIREAIASKIPIIAMVDTNTDPSEINFIIPANDDSPRSIEFIMNHLATYAQEGQKEYKEKIKKEETEKKPVKKTIDKKETKKVTFDTEKKPSIIKTVKKPTEKIVTEKDKTIKKEASVKTKSEEKKETKTKIVKKATTQKSIKSSKKISPEKNEDKTTKKISKPKTENAKSNKKT
ncbi:30S ribosomal protein S2 [Candidatus Babeliales bacterium]|nr:30S ribosomal protein S2 [Candidatus Babeliales bacterium]